MDGNNLNIDQLIGKIITEIINLNDQIQFNCMDGSGYMMYHMQDCCESVVVEDIIGDLNDLIGSPILKASEDCSNDDPEGYIYEGYRDSWTWTFYNIATIKGHVTIRWYGSSNGYYSESVDFIKVK